MHIQRRSQKSLPGFRIPFLLLSLIVLLLQIGCDRPASTGDSASISTETTDIADTAELKIDFDGKRDNISILVPCTLDSTVFQILKSARDMGQLEFESKGESEMAFVVSIGGVQNEGAAGRNWIFEVNGKLAHKGCGAFPVRNGDHILWRLGDYP